MLSHGRALVRRCLSTLGATSKGPATSVKPGSMYIWGKIDDNRIGMNLSHLKFGAQAIAMGPAIPPTLQTLVPPLQQVVCRASKTIALATDGSIFSWGSCKNQSLGHGLEVVTRPKKVEALNGINIVQVRLCYGAWRRVFYVRPCFV
jgi:alpha-tubulin suppressor-like RCC1 family protein